MRYTGPIAAQASTPIHSDDTITTLYARVEELALDLLTDVLPRLASGTQELRDQPNEPRRVMPQPHPKMGGLTGVRTRSSSLAGFGRRLDRILAPSLLLRANGSTFGRRRLLKLSLK